MISDEQANPPNAGNVVSFADQAEVPGQLMLIAMLEDALREAKQGKLIGIFMIKIMNGAWNTGYLLGPCRMSSLLGYLQISQHQLIQAFLDHE